jgi:hypothetical protein
MENRSRQQAAIQAILSNADARKNFESEMWAAIGAQFSDDEFEMTVIGIMFRATLAGWDVVVQKPTTGVAELDELFTTTCERIRSLAAGPLFEGGANTDDIIAAAMGKFAEKYARPAAS